MNANFELSQAAAADPAERAEPGIRYGWYIVGVLMLCYTLSFVDRQILSLLVAPIKADLHVSDTSVGLLQGFAFAVFYTLMGVPLGRAADRGNRRNLIIFGITVWSLMTALCASARSFLTLFLCRVGVGVGEAALSPAAFSMISDSLPREKLGRAFSVYSMGIYVGGGLAMIVGGRIVQATSSIASVTVPLLGTIAPWRLTFLLVGLPGLLAALWVMTLREPLRRGLLRGSDGRVVPMRMRDVVNEIGRRWQSFFGLAFGMVLQATVSFAFNGWAAAYFQRIHHWTPGHAGLVIGLMLLIGGTLGMALGGYLTDHWRARGRADAGLLVLIISAFGGMLFIPAFLSDNAMVTLILSAPGVALTAMPIGSAYASLQLIFPNQVRASATAFFMFLFNLGGMTLGPLLPGVFNDHLFHSDLALGRSLALTMAIATVGMIVIFGFTRAHYRRHHAELHHDSAGRLIVD